MKRILIIAVAAMFCAAVESGEAKGDDAATEALIDRLSGLIDEAERARAADPNFLADLRAAIAKRQYSDEPAPAPLVETQPPPATAPQQKSNGSLLSTLGNSLDELTGGEGLLSGLTGGESGGSGGAALTNA